MCLSYMKNHAFDVPNTEPKETKQKTSSESTTHANGFLMPSDQHWFHGELTREKAEQALVASGCDCFLIRQSQGALVLSLIQHGEIHHINIKCGPDWYELGDEHLEHIKVVHGSGCYRLNDAEHLDGVVQDVKITHGPDWYKLEEQAFNQLQELVGYYRTNPISDKINFLEIACKRVVTNGLKVTGK